MTTIEICVADVAGARAAAAGGAHRTELCQALEIGGITPSHGFLADAFAQAPDLGHAVMIRPRGGGFVYSPAELDVMEHDIREAVRLAAHLPEVGFAFGVLTPDGRIDVPAMRRLVETAEGRRVCCHKAFDAVPDQLAGLADLYEAGVNAVLTSGGGGAATDNLANIATLVAAAPADFAVTAAGGVRPHNVVQIVRETGVRFVHLRAEAIVGSGMEVPSEYDDGTKVVTDPAVVAAVVASLADLD